MSAWASGINRWIWRGSSAFSGGWLCARTSRSGLGCGCCGSWGLWQLSRSLQNRHFLLPKPKGLLSMKNQLILGGGGCNGAPTKTGPSAGKLFAFALGAHGEAWAYRRHWRSIRDFFLKKRLVCVGQEHPMCWESSCLCFFFFFFTEVNKGVKKMKDIWLGVLMDFRRSSRRVRAPLRILQFQRFQRARGNSIEQTNRTSRDHTVDPELEMTAMVYPQLYSF